MFNIKKKKNIHSIYVFSVGVEMSQVIICNIMQAFKSSFLM